MGLRRRDRWWLPLRGRLARVGDGFAPFRPSPERTGTGGLVSTRFRGADLRIAGGLFAHEELGLGIGVCFQAIIPSAIQTVEIDSEF
jgi:hypothetical protein